MKLEGIILTEISQTYASGILLSEVPSIGALHIYRERWLPRAVGEQGMGSCFMALVSVLEDKSGLEMGCTAT